MLSLACLGCTTMGNMGQGMKTAMRTDGADIAQETTGDPWVDGAGDYARKIHPAEEVNDPLHLREVFRDDKARSIERNLGVGN
jgi:hypothetical protein